MKTSVRPHVMDVCRQVMPGREYVAKDHWVRCHLYGPGADEPSPAASS